jgi:hypothetical protein
MACLQMDLTMAHSGLASSIVRGNTVMRIPIGIIAIEIKGPPAGG